MGNEVQAVQDLNQIEVIERKFRLSGWDNIADLWRIGVNFALRISDLLQIRFDQLEGEFLYVTEQKTRKPRRIKINDTARLLINKRRRQHPDHIYLFQATANRVANLDPKPLSRQYVSIKFALVGSELGLELGTHSMRKTRGYAMFQAGRPIEEIAKMLNHSNTGQTLRYIGIEQKNIDRTYTEFEL